ncbi:epoxide hydrolase family protein [uncultured Amnibacterium sp.]|uniref:epoxide hydrolase family protein n=1 Tax=uncultured Amnibacterium sp. TaxID=1631851 RepID=UPI0035C9BCC1
MEPFRVPESPDLTELHDRLRRTRFPAATPGPEWAAGTSPAFLRRLVAHWLERYDWPAQARRLNRYPHAIATLPEGRLHLVHLRNPGAPAIVLLHGWPYTFAEMLPLADALAADFEVVVPSLPGFCWSPALDEPFGDVVVARMVDGLMTDLLGHARYLTYGEDVGTWISDRVAGTYPGRVAGIVVTHPAYPPREERTALGEETARFFTALDERHADDRGYAEIQSTKPDTLAAALGDSPAGLAAWIVEKFRAWGDVGGDVESVFRLDDLITTVMLYWLTDSIGTSFRPYIDDPVQAAQPPIEVPAAIALALGDRGYPRALAEHTYRDIRTFRTLERGGHFVAREVPQEVAALVRSLR